MTGSSRPSRKLSISSPRRQLQILFHLCFILEAGMCVPSPASCTAPQGCLLNWQWEVVGRESRSMISTYTLAVCAPLLVLNESLHFSQLCLHYLGFSAVYLKCELMLQTDPELTSSTHCSPAISKSSNVRIKEDRLLKWNSKIKLRCSPQNNTGTLEV